MYVHRVCATDKKSKKLTLKAEMKQLKRMNRIIPCLTLIGLLSSCSDEDNQTDSNSFTVSIIGVWELTSAVSNGEELIENPDCLDRITITDTTYDYTEYFDFNDGNGCIVVPGQTESPEPYTLVDSNFSVTNEGEFFSYEIIELNSTTLKLQEVYAEDGETFTDIETYNKL